MTNHELISRLYKKMLLIRKFELRLAEIYHTDAIKSPVHLSVGQEAVAVGVCDVLNQEDIVSNTYRCHATYIAKGGDLNSMMAELYGKATGCAGGKAGSMHLIDIANGVLGASAVVGTTIPVAVGYALAFKMQQKNNIVVSFFGDGATEEGCFYESLNFAALHHIPILFICENNRLAIHTPIEKRWATENLCERVATYGIETHKIDSGDIFEIRQFTEDASSKLRNHFDKPIFLECSTYRWLEHVGPRDDHADNYRDLDEYRRWKSQDEITRLGQQLPIDIKNQIDIEVESLIQTAEKYADESPYPNHEELYSNVYAV